MEVKFCEGRCLRSFHATNDSGEQCPTLGYSRQQLDVMKVFKCKNCEYEIYQCFACGRLGSAKTNPPEVFPCASSTCGHFYHAKCVAQLLFPENEAKSTEYTAKIASGAKFACPLHKCGICKYGENKEDKELQFAVCRRCPKSYHRRCLPREIVFEEFTENGQCVFQRAWDDLLPNNRILIYCLKHEINPEYRTPTRNHIKFPEDPTALKKPLNCVNGMNKRTVKIRRLEELPSAPLSDKPLNCVNGINKKTVKIRCLEELPSAPLSNVKRSSCTVRNSSLRNLMNKRRKVTMPEEKPVVMTKLPDIDRDTEMRMYEFAQKVAAGITMEDVKKKLVVPSTHTPNQNADNITLEKVEGSVEAVKDALHMLENGASIAAAKSICPPHILFQLVKWKNKLNVFLAPFLHGMRYTSYGRHFTKLNKLQLIVDKLQWYIQSGDTVVDFCCGSNDFSLLLKETLESSGKNCFYKNYDLIQPKNDFNFERRDWMTVQPDELPTGCRLVMGLNPPFGFKASLANQFINKALTFKPKLIILIVPKETERLDKKYPPYELIWQDSDQLSGKSFYLPGSLGVDNKVMEQWNMSPPPLSLWSRSDWAKRHSDIAKSMRHIPNEIASSGDLQRDMAASVPTTEHVEIDDAEVAGIPPCFLDQLMSDTFHDPTTSPGDCWNDTNGRLRQPCNYETAGPGRNDPTYDHTDTCSDMSISLSESDFQRKDHALSMPEHGGTNSEASDAVGSASAEKPTVDADYDEVTSASGPNHFPGVASGAGRVQYWMMEDSPLLEDGELSDAPPVDRPAADTKEHMPAAATPRAASWCGQPDHSPPVPRHNARTLPPRNTFPGLRLRQGCNTSRQFLPQGTGHQAVHQGPSNAWIEDEDY
ncbi:hypothetical protein SORBI_3007G214900 [Sorghum bicolor]|uniref:RING-type domain-containing protein n=1 Tax=Sorghum bicolor TaxID=4558 RepID=A0A1B6PJ43_SORBI|nr:hypothetical protein SORBI_3007G214900 [Sorghum bicolor]